MTNSTNTDRGRLAYRARRGDQDAKEQLKRTELAKHADAPTGLERGSQPDNIDQHGRPR